jgi:alkanesulfonate monooxygenase SsuD/methylene tetrahydromethanopterin reductase-like flavin-dependent oxidoreductase (luciferase family)
MMLGVYRDELENLGRDPGTREIVLRRELVLDHDPERARAIGLRARNALSAKYAAFNAPDSTDVYRHLQGDSAASEVADANYIFTDPATCVARLNELSAAGVTYVILRAQWLDMPYDQVLRTLRLFREEVRPYVA